VPRIVPIVEGHGEVESVPLLIRRIAESVASTQYVDVFRPIRVKRQKIVIEGELEKAIELAAMQTNAGDAILVLLDAEQDCPATLGPSLLARAVRARSDRNIRVVIAKREYEAWFLAAAHSIAGHRGLAANLEQPSDPEGNPSAKAWLTAHMRAGAAYRETLDQPALTAIFDLQAARNAPSFDKLWRDVASVV
jgi:hypothetical protein